MSTLAVAVKSTLKRWAAEQPMVTAEQIQVTYGFPTREPDRRWIAVGDINWSESRWATNRARQEAFTVSVIFNVQVPAGTAEEAEAFAIEMAKGFEGRLKADPSIGGLCVTSGFNPRRLKSWPIDGAYEAQFETEVTAACRP
ncbi:hypothetical protein AB0M54_46000 [Actinoplanes sp. NPDC051470]|uniref:hypothetical protein n=1 Tax=Actinoplanes sp. NPDC051470 TaxID=3157224 RepID=UPI00343E5323